MSASSLRVELEEHEEKEDPTEEEAELEFEVKEEQEEEEEESLEYSIAAPPSQGDGTLTTYHCRDLFFLALRLGDEAGELMLMFVKMPAVESTSESAPGFGNEGK